MPMPSARVFVLATLSLAASGAGGTVAVAAESGLFQTPAQASPVVPDEGIYTIRSCRDRVRLAIADFTKAAGDGSAEIIGLTIADVLWNDLAFEREFVMIPRDAASTTAPEAVIHGTVDVQSGVATVEVQLVPAGRQEPLFSRRYTGSTANPRAFAHTIADQIHERALLFVTR